MSLELVDLAFRVGRDSGASGRSLEDPRDCRLCAEGHWARPGTRLQIALGSQVRGVDTGWL